jgi:hypothetical protein
LLGAWLTPGDVGPGGDTTRGGARKGRVELLHTDLPAHRLMTPEGEAGGRRWGGVAWRAVAPRPLDGGRGGVGPGVPHSPYYPGPQAGEWGLGEGGESWRSLLTTNVGWRLALATKSIMLGRGYTSSFFTRLSLRESPHGLQLPSASCTICKRLD